LEIGVRSERYVAANADTLVADQKSAGGTSAAEAADVNAVAPAGEARQVALGYEAA
jgi:hypothetical protein